MVILTVGRWITNANSNYIVKAIDVDRADVERQSGPGCL